MRNRSFRQLQRHIPNFNAVTHILAEFHALLLKAAHRPPPSPFQIRKDELNGLEII